MARALFWALFLTVLWNVTACGPADRSEYGTLDLDLISDVSLPDDAGIAAETDAVNGADAIDVDEIASDSDTVSFTCDVHQEANTLGLRTCTKGTSEGYTLFATVNANLVFLIDNLGNETHRWKTSFTPGFTVYLLENGDLLMAGVDERTPSRLHGGGMGGVVQRIAWDGSVLWEFSYTGDQHRQHHDIAPLPNGNILMIAWEYKSDEEALAAGRSPQALSKGQGLWPDHIIEIKPEENGGTIVWEWHVWDHLIQDSDPAKPGYGKPADHPELIDINANRNQTSDFIHMNAIDYNEKLDQILLTVWGTSEVWIIDHSTTVAEAAEHTGGRYGKGGDILYRWGNPAMYGRGTVKNQLLFNPHSAHWIADDLPGKSNILIFNNFRPLAGGGYFSSVDEISSAHDSAGNYDQPDGVWGPETPVWQYTADPADSFFELKYSGAQRLPNGNTLIVQSSSGHLFEITSSGTVVWDYISPVTEGSVIHQNNNSPLAGNIIFRAHRYPPDHPGLAGKDLTSKGAIE